MNNNLNKLLNKKHILYRLLFRLIGKKKFIKKSHEIEMISFNI